MKSLTKVAFLIAILLLLLVGFLAFPKSNQDLASRPYPVGATAFTYAGVHLQEFDRQQFAIFHFGNALGVRVTLEETLMIWNEQTSSWQEEKRYMVGALPNRRLCEILIAREGKWKVILRAYAIPSPLERLRNRLTNHRQGGLVGAWSSPEMIGAKPASQVP